VLRHLGTGANAMPAHQSRRVFFSPSSSTSPSRNNMTGFSALPMADEAASEGAAQWTGVAKVLGPPWARLPVITGGFVGVQVLWSIEMAYGEQSNTQPGHCVTRKSCSFALPHLPRPLKISDGPRLHRWTPLRSHRSTPHRSAPLFSFLHRYHKLIVVQVS